MKYKVTIRETLERTLDVEANSAQEAELSVRQDYHNSIIVLDDGDFIDTIIMVQQLTCK
ncbi:MAG: DpnD/PcfM family protein [Bacteroidales bacterium]|nr:DpnD/PcfM family protein [Bacteroidales bacterium]